ncbi:hypothetical protein V496_00285 [Pseudogymnoascus sp. VKM F-4515 (FW-2607)]|nr:hypothetical protein V496_00285 [Pseudogymnoascus sp. VKM F-4515 (FW-2607)]KFY95037.1 hypothetical protein V498_03550 [Pseudogymnoascus sp. VKM F-4517 (FW-2822)]
MKYSIVFIGALAALVTAQSELSQCGQQCVKDMLAQAAALGCTSADAACLCNKSDFAYGIRDCANEACGPDADKIIAYGTNFCKGNNGGSDDGNGGAGGAGSASGSATGTAISSSPSATGGAGNGGGAVGGGAGGASGSGSGAVGGPVPITTSAVVSESKTVGSTTIYSSDASATPVTTIVSDGKAVTTLYGAVGAGGANGGSGSGSSGSGSESTVTSGSSTFVTTVSSGAGSESTGGSGSGGDGETGAGAGGAGSTGGSGSGSGGETSTSSAGGARQTAAAAGVMAVAGLAAFVL